MKSVIALFLYVFILATATSAQSPWEDAIGSVSEKSSRYYDYAIGLDPTSTPGAALHGIGHHRHLCAIVGRMLGFRKDIREAETFDDPPLTANADAFELMEHSLFLDSWVAAARRAVSMTTKQKKSVWNLECVGKHGIPVNVHFDGADVHGDFSVNERVLLVYGDINSDFFKRFSIALDANPQLETVALGSAGGSVVDAILSGLEIRKRGLNTTLHGPCFSACPLVFAGGKERTIWVGPGPHLGFHRVYTSTGAVPLADPIYQHIADYLTIMGVDPVTVIRWMASAGPEEMYEPDLDLTCEPRLATWVQRVCGF